MMDAARFDLLSESLSSRFSRRNAFVTGVAGLSALMIRPSLASAQNATPAAQPSTPSTIYVQLADHGSRIPKPDAPGVYLLTLSGAGEQTLYFSDQPDRIVGTLPTDQFLDALGFTPVEPPNAAIVVTTPEGERDVLVVELFDPVYTRTFGEQGEEFLTYDAKVLNAYTGEGLEEWAPQAEDDQLPSEFSDVSLFIDDCADLSGCYTMGFWGLNYIGEIPGGPYGRCWDWSVFTCRPCDDSIDYDGICNATYPACEGRCGTDTCGMFSC